MYILVLLLENNKYFLLINKDVNINNINKKYYRLNWIKQNKIIKFAETPIKYISTTQFNNTLYEYMSTYGIDNVRGGTYTRINLYKKDINFLENQIKKYKNIIVLDYDSSEDVCDNCDRIGHSTRNCKFK